MADWKLEEQGAMRWGRRGFSQLRSEDREKGTQGHRPETASLGCPEGGLWQKGDRRHSQERGHSRTSRGLDL